MKQITKTDGTVIDLNEQQEEALNLMLEWAKRPDKLFFCLSGYAGTGKTTIINQVLADLSNSVKRKGITVSAPTHKAKTEVEMSTGVTGKTIQALLGLAPDVLLDDFDVNRPEFAQSRPILLKEYKLVVIDEASMFPTKLFNSLLDTARNTLTKIIFMCDEAQLPPVKELISPVISSDEIEDRYQLTIVERQKEGNPLLLECDSVRNNLSSAASTLKYTTNINEHGGIEYIPTLKEFGNKVVSEFVYGKSTVDPLECRVLCYYNERVAFWNKAIKSSIFNTRIKTDSSLSEEQIEDYLTLAPNDLLLAYTNNPNFSNSQELRVLEVTKEQIEYNTSNREAILEVYVTRMEEIKSKSVMFVNILVPTVLNINTFKDIFSYNLHRAKAYKKWKDYYQFKESILLLQDVRDNGRLLIKKDLDYAYALTVHKAQGSTYNKVFIDMPDIRLNRKVEERNKLTYVALSRPRHTAHILAA